MAISPKDYDPKEISKKSIIVDEIEKDIDDKIGSYYDGGEIYQTTILAEYIFSKCGSAIYKTLRYTSFDISLLEELKKRYQKAGWKTLEWVEKVEKKKGFYEITLKK